METIENIADEVLKRLQARIVSEYTDSNYPIPYIACVYNQLNELDYSMNFVNGSGNVCGIVISLPIIYELQFNDMLPVALKSISDTIYSKLCYNDY